MISAKIMELLKRDPVRNANIIGFVENYPITKVASVGQSVLVIGQSDKAWAYISSESAGELRQLLEFLSPADVNFAVIEDWMMPIITAGRSTKGQLATLRLALPSSTELPPLPTEVPTTKLGPEAAEYIYNNYSYREYTDVAYITDRLKNGPSAGVFYGTKLVAWALTHDDGAIGFLQALEEYRGRGYALAVTRTLVEEVRSQGKVPFVHIEESNVKSLGLAKKLGFVPDRRVQWFSLESEDVL